MPITALGSYFIFSSRRCNTCGEYIYKGKKFNARKETVEGEDYYGIKIFRYCHSDIYNAPRTDA